jgi:cation transport ATPase
VHEGLRDIFLYELRVRKERMQMNTGSHEGWPQRIVWSCVVSTAAVVFSGLFILFLASGQPSTTKDFISYVVGIPLMPGAGVVAIYWGWWQALHSGQIGLVPPISIVADSAVIFAIWEFVYGARTPKRDVYATLNLNK